MIGRIEECVKLVSHAIHISKPVLLECVLFVVFLVETWHWLTAAVAGD